MRLTRHTGSWIVALFALVILIPALSQAAVTRDQAVSLVEQQLLPQGSDDVVLKTWGPVPAGTAIHGTKGPVFTTPAEGWAVYLDENPTANMFHPVRYAFVNAATGAVQVFAAASPPENEPEYQPVSTAVWRQLMAAENRVAPSFSGVTPPPPPTTRGERWAVLMNGGYNSSNNHVRYWNDLSNIYKALTEVYLFPDDRIIVLCSDGTNPAPDQSNGQNSNPDLDGDGDPDIMFSCILVNVDAVFAQLATQLSADDKLFIFTTDHGETAGGWNTNQNLWNQQVLTDAHFAQLLDALPDCEIISTLEPCYSGGFLDNIVVPPGPRVASSACAYNQLSWAMPPGYVYDTYVFHWTAAVKGEDAYGVAVDADYNNDGVVDMQEAFRYAEEHDTSNEDPQYNEYPQGLGATLTLWPSAAPLAPAAPTGFTLTHNNTQLTASLSWTNPTLTFGGDPLTDLDSICVKRNGQVVASLTGTPGQAMSYNDDVPSAALYSYQVYGVNDAGNGVSANGSTWIGLDVPAAPTGVTATTPAWLTASLSWVAPTAGAHGGYWPAGSWDGQKIYRNAALLTTLNGTNTTYTDNLTTSGQYTYGVAYFNTAGDGPTVNASPLNVQGPPQWAAISIPFYWVEISGTGTNTGINADDQNLGPFPMGAGFHWWDGTTITQMRVCSNGWISPTSTSTAYSNGAIPSTTAPNDALYMLWDDLNPGLAASGDVWYHYDAANQRWILEFDNVSSYSSPNTPQKFEAIFYQAGYMDLLYHTVQAPCANSNTAGIENSSGMDALQCAYNGSGSYVPASNYGIRISSTSLPPPNVEVTLAPLGAPLQIPAVGGTFSFDASVANSGTSTITCNAWIGQWVP
ncbi:MAG: hypothetical protein C4524_04640, partial [Candidatus Zixiibacteriota bacterium]